MRTKEEYYELILNNRRILSDPKNLRCPCPKTKCEWHGRCRECVALHRYSKRHVPNCIQQYINERLKAVARIGELTEVEDEMTPSDYWDYVRAQDRKKKTKKK